MRRARHDATSMSLDVLEARRLLAVVSTFGPETLSPLRASDVVMVDLDDDGVLDRLSSFERRLTFEKGLGDGAYVAPASITLPGRIGTLAAGRFLGQTGGGPGWMLAAVELYRDAGVPASAPASGYIVRLFDVASLGTQPVLTSRTFVRFTSTATRIASATLLVGNLLSDSADELIVGLNLVTPGDGAGATRGRVLAQALTATGVDRIVVARTLMDRSFTAPRERFDAPRVQLADLNADGRTDALVRPITTWRAELGPTASSGASSLLTTARQLPGSDEAAAGGRFLFTDVTGDGLADRVLVRLINTAGAQSPGAAAALSVRVGVETGIVNFGYQTRFDQSVQQVFAFGDTNAGGAGGLPSGTYRPTRLSNIQIDAADIDNDGQADLLITGTAERTLVGGAARLDRSWAAALLRSDAGVFSSRQELGTVETVSLTGFRLGDVDGDGLADLLGVGAVANRGVSVFVNDTDALG